MFIYRGLLVSGGRLFIWWCQLVGVFSIYFLVYKYRLGVVQIGILVFRLSIVASHPLDLFLLLVVLDRELSPLRSGLLFGGIPFSRVSGGLVFLFERLRAFPLV